jgi:hypothetical protein
MWQWLAAFFATEFPGTVNSMRAARIQTPVPFAISNTIKVIESEHAQPSQLLGLKY